MAVKSGLRYLTDEDSALLQNACYSYWLDLSPSSRWHLWAVLCLLREEYGWDFFTSEKFLAHISHVRENRGQVVSRKEGCPHCGAPPRSESGPS